VVAGDAMDGVAFGHDGRERTMVGPWLPHRAPNARVCPCSGSTRSWRPRA
jgi:hypothetical protein